MLFFHISSYFLAEKREEGGRGAGVLKSVPLLLIKRNLWPMISKISEIKNADTRQIRIVLCFLTHSAVFFKPVRARRRPADKGQAFFQSGLALFAPSCALRLHEKWKERRQRDLKAPVLKSMAECYRKREAFVIPVFLEESQGSALAFYRLWSWIFCLPHEKSGLLTGSVSV